MSANPLRWEANAFVGFVERQTNLVKRYWTWEMVWLFYSLVSVLSIGFLASGLGSLGGGIRDLREAQLYLLVGALLWSFLSLVFVEVAYAITWERWEGTIEYTFMAPIHRVTHLLGICLFAILYGLLRTAVVLAVSALLFRIDLSHADLAAATLVLMAAMVPLIGLGIAAAVLPLLSPEKGEQMTVAAQGFLLLISGVYYPLSVMPWPFQVAGRLSPLTYALDGIRGALIRGEHVAALLPTVGLLLAMGVVLIPAGLWIFARAERRAKRLGLLKRSG